MPSSYSGLAGGDLGPFGGCCEGSEVEGLSEQSGKHFSVCMVAEDGAFVRRQICLAVRAYSVD